MRGMSMGMGLSASVAGAATASAVTAVEVLGDLTQTVLTPASAKPVGLTSISVPTNGWVLKVTTNTALAPDAPTSFDATKVMVTLTRNGWAADGSQTSYTVYAFGTALLRYPHTPDGATFYQSGAGTYYVTLDKQIYHDSTSDYTGRSYIDTIVGVSFAGSWLPGQSATLVGSGLVTRSDTAVYTTPIWKRMDPTLREVATSYRSEWSVWDQHFMNGSMVAAVESWFTDGTNNLTGGTSQAISNGMELSNYTGPSTPSGLNGYVHATTAEVHSSLSDGIIYERSRVKPWYGPARESTTVGDSIATNWTFNLPTGYPEWKDNAGNYTLRHMWVNADRSGLTSASTAGVGTTSTDPGTGNSYQSFAAAAVAGRTVNTARGHTDYTALVIHLRGVTQTGAGGEGNNPESYCNDATWESLAQSTLGPKCQVIGHPIGGDLNTVRIRPLRQDGSAVTSKFCNRKVMWQSVKFDGSSSPVIDGNTSGNSSANQTLDAVALMDFIDCELTTGGSVTKCGLQHYYRTNIKAYTSGGSPIQGGMGNNVGPAVIAGSRFIGDGTSRVPFCNILGSRLDAGCQSQGGNLTTLRTIRGQLASYSVFDADNTAGQAFTLMEERGRVQFNDLGFGFHSCLFRRQAGSGPFMRIGGDGVRFPFANAGMSYCNTAGGTTSGGAAGTRINMLYNDQGYIGVNKTASFKFCGFSRTANKDATFGGGTGENPVTQAAVNNTSGVFAIYPYASQTQYYEGDIIHSGTTTGTPGAVGQVKTAFLQATYADYAAAVAAGVVYDAGAVWAADYGGQTQRRGNAAFRYGVNCEGCVNGGSVQSVSSDNTPTYNNSWLSTLVWPRCGTNGSGPKWGFGDVAAYFVNDTAGSGALSSYGDYRPVTAGDLLNMVYTTLTLVDGSTVAVDRRADVYDALGTARKTDGTGAACWLEHL